MNVDELKIAWQRLDRKLDTTKTLNEKLIVSIVTERSANRFQSVKRNYVLGFVWLAFCFAIGLAVIIGNPFDYQYQLQFLPMVIYCVCLLIIVASMISSYQKLDRITLDHSNIKNGLAAIIAVYERPQKFMKYILYTFIFCQTILFPFSFLPKSIDRMGLWPAIFERLIPISITILLLFVAHKLGAFKERHADKFKADLNELNELRSIASELNEK